MSRCEGRYPVPQTSPPRNEPFEATYRCALPLGHDGPHGAEPPAMTDSPPGRPSPIHRDGISVVVRNLLMQATRRPRCGEPSAPRPRGRTIRARKWIPIHRDGARA